MSFIPPNSSPQSPAHRGQDQDRNVEFEQQWLRGQKAMVLPGTETEDGIVG
jgi:hypothetical protein